MYRSYRKRSSEEIRRHNARYRDYRDQYTRDNYEKVVVILRKDRDAKLINWLKSRQNVSAYIRDLVQDDMLIGKGVI